MSRDSSTVQDLLAALKGVVAYGRENYLWDLEQEADKLLADADAAMARAEAERTIGEDALAAIQRLQVIANGAGSATVYGGEAYLDPSHALRDDIRALLAVVSPKGGPA
jgi:hypothetical protein